MNNIKYLTGVEWKNFTDSDERKYILKENKDFLLLYKKMIKEGIDPILDIENIQKMMNKITTFFEFKYPEFMFENIVREYRDQNDEKTIVNNEIIKLSKSLDVCQLKYRLSYNTNKFLECNYKSLFTLNRTIERYNLPSKVWINVEPDGTIPEFMLQNLRLDNFIENIDNVVIADDLLEKLESVETIVDYSELTDLVKRHKYNVIIRNKVLQLIPLQMIYNDPIYGYYRAKSFIRMFNKEYNLDLNLNEEIEILSKDYSNNSKIKKRK